MSIPGGLCRQAAPTQNCVDQDQESAVDYSATVRVLVLGCGLVTVVEINKETCLKDQTLNHPRTAFNRRHKLPDREQSLGCCQ